MSTENVHDEAEAARRALGQLTNTATRRVEEIGRRRRGLQNERGRVVTGARLAMRDIDDEDEVLEEEHDQLDGAINPPEPEPEPEPAPAASSSPSPPPAPPVSVTPPEPPLAPPVVVPPAPAPVQLSEPPPIYNREELESMRLDQLQRIAEYYIRVCGQPPYDAEVTEQERLIVVIILLQNRVPRPVPPAPAPPVNPPTAPLPVQPPQRIERRSRLHYVWEWSGLQWLAAAVGVIVALALYSIWPNWPGRNIEDGTVQDIVNTLWLIAHVLVGFFIGGFVGLLIEENRAEHVVEEEVVVEAV